MDYSSARLAVTATLLICLGVTQSCRSVVGSEKNTTSGTTATGTTEASARKSSRSMPAPAGMTRYTVAVPTGHKASSAVQLEKLVPAEVGLNQEFEYQIRVENLTDQTLGDIVVSDQLTPNFKIKSTEPALLSNAGGVARWAIGSLGANETTTIRVRGSAIKVGTITGCASVTYVPRICASTNVVRPAIQLAKVAPAQVMICDEINVRYTVTNSGSGTARDITVSETLPSNLQTKDGRPVRFKLSQLGAGKSHTFNVKMKATKTGTYAGAANAKASGNLTANSERTTIAVKEPKLSITMKGPSRGFLGRNTTYDITVKNTGDAVAKRTRIEDTIPSGAKFVSATKAGSPSGSKVVWSLGDMAPNATQTVSVTVTATQPRKLQSTATAQAICAPNVTASAATEYIGVPAILLEVVDLQDPIVVGEETTYEIRVTNQGSANGTNIKIECVLEDAHELISATGATKSTHSNRQITFTPLPSLGAKKQATWRVRVKAADQGDIRFKVRMTSDQIKRPVEETEATNFYK